MNRREFIGSVAVAIAACAVPLSASAATPLKVFEFVEDGEWHCVAATSWDEAMSIWWNLWGEPPERRDPARISEIRVVPDDEEMTVRDSPDSGDTETKSASQWAKAGPGMIWTTAGY